LLTKKIQSRIPRSKGAQSGKGAQRLAQMKSKITDRNNRYYKQQRRCKSQQYCLKTFRYRHDNSNLVACLQLYIGFYLKQHLLPVSRRHARTASRAARAGFPAVYADGSPVAADMQHSPLMLYRAAYHL